jgi:hypothetical protein
MDLRAIIIQLCSEITGDLCRNVIKTLVFDSKELLDKMVVILAMFCNEIILNKDLRNKIHNLLSNALINRLLVKYFNA